MENNTIKLVIFDMDGTIFDTERLGIECWVKAFEESGIPFKKEILFDKIGLNGKDSKRFMEESCDVTFDYNFVKETKQRIIKEYIEKNGTPVKDGFFDLVKFLKQKKIKIALATSRGREMTEYYLEKAGQNCIKYFDILVTGDMIEKGKPNPDIFLHSAKALGILPKNSLVIEDSINGVKAAIAADMRVIMIPDLVEPDEKTKMSVFKIKHNLHEVINVVKKINSEVLDFVINK